jgi:replication fork clamp-binding protein CrfC
MVELRDNIMDEVTKLYFERIRVKMEMNNFSIEDIRKIQEKELKLEELTSSLDALTGGYFSSHITHK